MNCPKCGKENENGAAFCGFCGASFEGAAAPAPAPKEKKRWVPPLCIAAAVIAVGIAAVLLFVKPGGSVPVAEPNGSPSVTESTGLFSNKPIPEAADERSDKPVMTINGEEIPVDFAYLIYMDIDTGSYTDAAVFGGKKGDRMFTFTIASFLDLQPDTVYRCTEEDQGMIGFGCYIKEPNYRFNGHVYEGYAVSWSEDRMSGAEIVVGDYKKNDYIEISASGTAYCDDYPGESSDRISFKFQVSGRLDYLENGETAANEWFDRNRITDDSAPSTEPVTERTTVSEEPVREERVTEITIKGERISTDLTVLDLAGKGLIDEDIQDLKYMTKLKRIILADNSLSDISVLRNIPTLEEIDADNNLISDISFMRDLRNLKIVVMNSNRIRDISVFSEFTTIEKIWLCYNEITDISPIAGNTGLTEVGFNGCTIGDVSALRNKSKLGLLCLWSCGIEDLSPLSSCSSLYELHLGMNRITDFSPLAKLENLETLNLDDNGTMTWEKAETLKGIKISGIMSLCGMGVENDAEMASWICQNIRYGSNDAYVLFLR